MTVTNKGLGLLSSYHDVQKSTITITLLQCSFIGHNSPLLNRTLGNPNLKLRPRGIHCHVVYLVHTCAYSALGI